MNQVVNAIRTFVQSEDGPTAVEYGVLVALIILAAAGAITSFGSSLGSLFTSAGSKLTVTTTGD